MCLLTGESLVVIALVEGDAPWFEIKRLDLSEARLSRSALDFEKQPSIWWVTKWHISDGTTDVFLTGNEGPVVSGGAEGFARAVARAAGWPIDGPPDRGQPRSSAGAKGSTRIKQRGKAGVPAEGAR